VRGDRSRRRSSPALRAALRSRLACLSSTGLDALGLDALAGGAAGQGGCSSWCSGKLPGAGAELEDGDLAAGALADPQRDDGGADAGADVHGAARGGLAAGAVDAVDVAVADDAAERELVERARVTWPAWVWPERTSETPAVHRRSASSAMCDRPRVGRSARRPWDGALPVGVAGVGVVEADDLEALVAQREGGVGVVEDLGAGADEGAADLVGAGPVVVVAEDATTGAW
jgi:hypothetical protein